MLRLGFLIILGAVFSIDKAKSDDIGLILNDVQQFKELFSNKETRDYGSIYENDLKKLRIFEDTDTSNNPSIVLDILKASEKVIYCNNKSIYECDSRTESRIHSDERMRKLSRSVLALVNKNKLKKDGNFYRFNNAVSLEETRSPMCQGEPFRSQKVVSFCTGFLISEDLFATAGHCVSGINNGAYAVFDFIYELGSEVPLKESSVSKINKIVEFKNNNGEDWAIVKLTNKSDRDPLKIRRAGKISDKSETCVIGHPSGLPMKTACDAQVISNDDNLVFKSNLDTYGGNSGSPVFDRASGIVEGILVRGEQDYIRHPLPNGSSCWRSNICGDDGSCSGESVTRSTIWAGKVPQKQNGNLAKTNSGCVAGRLYTAPSCDSGYFENGVYHHPN